MQSHVDNTRTPVKVFFRQNDDFFTDLLGSTRPTAWFSGPKVLSTEELMSNSLNFIFKNVCCNIF